jgi:hypothetical protein
VTHCFAIGLPFSRFFHPVLARAHISPHCAMTTSCAGLPSGLATVRVFSILFTTSMPSMTLPNTTCLPLRWGVPLLDVMMKNWQPLVLGLVGSVDGHSHS